MTEWWSAIGAFVLSLVGTLVTLRYAVQCGMLDIPNARSSHRMPTPRGGGIAIVCATTLASVWLLADGDMPLSLLMAAILGGVVVAVVGYLDDRYHLRRDVRLLAHIAAATWALYWLGGFPPVRFGDQIVDLGWAGNVAGVLAITWALNLFNFMDGIDGIAASEAIFICLAGALLTFWSGADNGVVGLAIVVACASLGFLAWNWPPARIFMGDVGSSYCGYLIAVLAVAAAFDNPAALFVWLILGGTFFLDATVTLLRRLARFERVYEAHRSHAYQRLALRLRSHKWVTFLTAAVNLFWLFPCAYFATRYPGYAAWITVGALVPVAVAVTIVGAGKR